MKLAVVLILVAIQMIPFVYHSAFRIYYGSSMPYPLRSDRVEGVVTVDLAGATCSFGRNCDGAIALVCGQLLVGPHLSAFRVQKGFRRTFCSHKLGSGLVVKPVLGKNTTSEAASALLVVLPAACWRWSQPHVATCAIALLMSRVAHLDYYREGFRAPRTLFSCLTTSLHVSATPCPRVCTLQHTVQKVTSLRC